MIDNNNNTNINSSNNSDKDDLKNSEPKDGLSNILPEYVDIEKLASQGYHWQGEFRLTDYKRLAEIVSQKPQSTASLAFSISQSSGVYWFEFNAAVEVQTQCQRCLQQMNLPLTKNVKLALLEDEEQAGQLDDDDDWVLIEDVAERVGREIRLPIARVIEDEMLLEVPLAPKHEINDENCVLVDIIDEDEELEEEKQNPFAVLAGLKGQLKS